MHKSYLYKKGVDTSIGNLLNPKNDYVFKRIFGYVGNENITKNLINSIVDDIHIQSLTLDCKEILEQDLKTDKFGVLDIRAIIDNNIQCNIEMQIVDRKDIENRLLFYWSKLYSKTIKLGKDYINAQKTIIILFTDYEIKGLEKIEKYFSKWHICEDEYKNIILTKNLEIYILELPKFEKYTNTNLKLNAWVKFITNPGGITMDDMENNKSLKEAKQVLQQISDDEKEQYLAEQRLMYIMDQKAIEAAGFDKGKEEGLKEGLKKGKKTKAEEIAKAMLKQNIDLTIIISCTGLTENEIKSLK
ncbi:MAG: Rpn family recombination-promoting nuclease/putative transposase [Clostridia bacterium]|nr:Rpn family recombination-promoting nuclease/putative transposase [Clostridia bacterium]